MSNAKQKKRVRMIAVGIVGVLIVSSLTTVLGILSSML